MNRSPWHTGIVQHPPSKPTGNRLLYDYEPPGGSRASSHRSDSKSSPREYARQIGRLESIGMVSFAPGARCVIGVFVVKMGGGMQRLMLDCCPSNRLFRDAPRTELVTGEDLSCIEVDLSQFEQVPVIHFGASDGKSCFHRMSLPEHSGLRMYLSLQPFLPGILAPDGKEGAHVRAYFLISQSRIQRSWCAPDL